MRGGGGGGKLRKTGPPSTDSEGRGSSAQSLTGSWGDSWPHFCWAGSELETTGKREAKFIRLGLWPMARLTALGGNLEWLKVRPLLKSPFAFSDTEGACEEQPQQAQVRTSLDHSKVSSLLQKCCRAVGTAVQRPCIGRVCPQPRVLLAAQSQLERWPVPHEVRTFAGDRCSGEGTAGGS